MDSPTKTCSSCKNIKPLFDFNNLKASKDGLQNWCKQCTTQANQRYAKRNKARSEDVVKALQIQIVKLCRKCETNKPPADFHKSARSNDGLQQYCKHCVSEHHAAYYKRYKENPREPTYSRPNATTTFCIRCNTEKPLVEFGARIRNASNRDGLSTYCLECLKIVASNTYVKHRKRRLEESKAYYDAHREQCAQWTAAWQAANKEHCKAWSAAYRTANKELIRAKALARYASNPSKYLEKARRYKEANPEKVRANWHKVRARRGKAVGSHTAEDIKKLMVLQRGKCPVCKKDIRKKYHVDHVLALARGGTNNADNLQLLCQRCNNQKHAKHPIDFMREKGYLL